jgi:hypothetical protein
MPDAKAALHLERVFSCEEYERISLGCIPRDMDDRWLIYLEGEWLHLHRSWTGFCVYQVRLQAVGNSYRITEAWVNRDREQYVGKVTITIRPFYRFLIDRALLGRETPYPSDPLISELRRPKWWQLWKRLLSA